MLPGAGDDMDFLNPLFVITSMMTIHVAYNCEEHVCDFAYFVVSVMIRDTDTDADGDDKHHNAGSGNPYHRCFPEHAMIWMS